MRYSIIVVWFLFITGCASLYSHESASGDPSKEKAIIKFTTLLDVKKWYPTSNDVRWGIAISKNNITKVVKKDLSYNQPFYSIKESDKYIVARDIKRNEEVTISVDPGIYDWLILIDSNNDGVWGSYFGTAEEQITLNEFEFKSGYIYTVVIGEDKTPKLTITQSNK